MRTIICIVIALSICPCSVSADTHVCSSCAAADVNAAITEAEAGDTVAIPAGGTDPLCIWGTNTATVTIDKAITLQGAGKTQTIITVGTGTALDIAATASGCKVSNFKMVTNEDTASNASFITPAAASNEWCVKEISLDQTVKTLGYIINLTAARASGVSKTYGVIVKSDIMFDGEQINFRGPCDSWDKASSIGGAENLFFDACTFTKRPGGSMGYIDCNANSRTAFRWCYFNGVYVDLHGSWSNSGTCDPEYHESARHVEIVSCKWDGEVGWTSMYIRGGTGVLCHNTLSNTTYGWIFLDEYYVRSGRLSASVTGTDSNVYTCKLSHTSSEANKPITGENWATYWDLGQQGGYTGTVWASGTYYPADSWPYYHNGCACDVDYPVLYQVGRGINLTSPPEDGNDQASEPLYIWDNTINGEALTVLTNVYGGPDQQCKDYCNDSGLSCSDFIQAGRDYVLSAKSGYTPYQYPNTHPLTGYTGTCDTGIAGPEGYNLSSGITGIGSGGTATTGGSGTLTLTSP